MNTENQTDYPKLHSLAYCLDSKNYYQNPPQVWDAKACARFAKRRETNAYGDKDPFPGLLHWGPFGVGEIRYNGGCIREGEWYPGEIVPLPIVADGFKWEHVLSWGWRLVKL